MPKHTVKSSQSQESTGHKHCVTQSAEPRENQQMSNSHHGSLWQATTSSSHPGFRWQSTTVQQSSRLPLSRTQVQQSSRLPRANTTVQTPKVQQSSSRPLASTQVQQASGLRWQAPKSNSQHHHLWQTQASLGRGHHSLIT